MGMSTNIIGLVSEDNPEFQKHKRILLMCKKEKVSLPSETEESFTTRDGAPSDFNDTEDAIDYKKTVEINKFLTTWRGNSQEGYELKISDIPKGIDTLRFYNSW